MSNIHDFFDRGTIEQEAREWLIRLDSEIPLASNEADALREWLERSPAHGRELKRISSFWDNANILTQLAVPLNKPHPHTGKGFMRRVAGLFPRYGTDALTIAVLLCVTIVFMSWLLPQSQTADKGIYATDIGRQKTVTLADGSTVQLNTDSLVQVDYNSELRRIRLLRGEVHFVVSRDTGRPFEVYADGNMVRAIGTAFSVQLLDDDVRVTVGHGKVELVSLGHVRAGNETLQSEEKILGSLERGQSTTFRNTRGNLRILNRDELARQLSWRQGFLSFSGEPLSSVISQINRYTPKTIEIADPELRSLPVGGRFKVDEIEEIFEVLKTSFNIRISRIGDQHILLHSASD